MANDDYERIILVKPEVFMYKIPPRTTNRAYRAADWKLDAPDWQGRMRIVSQGNNCIIKLEDKLSGTFSQYYESLHIVTKHSYVHKKVNYSQLVQSMAIQERPLKASRIQLVILLYE